MRTTKAAPGRLVSGAVFVGDVIEKREAEIMTASDFLFSRRSWWRLLTRWGQAILLRLRFLSRFLTAWSGSRIKWQTTENFMRRSFGKHWKKVRSFLLEPAWYRARSAMERPFRSQQNMLLKEDKIVMAAARTEFCAAASFLLTNPLE